MDALRHPTNGNIIMTEQQKRALWFTSFLIKFRTFACVANAIIRLYSFVAELPEDDHNTRLSLDIARNDLKSIIRD